MARRVRSPQLETRTARLRLAVRKKPVFQSVAPGVGLGYRRGKTAGRWIVRAADGHGANWTKVIGIADDHEESNGETILSYGEAQDRARQIARGQDAAGNRPITVGEAVDHYAANLKARGSEVGNATRVRFHLPSTLASKTVALLGSRELRLWRDTLVEQGLAPATADRTARVLKAALSLAANDDPRITNASAWRTGLSRLPGGENVRHAILDDATVRALVRTAYQIGGEHYGLLIEVLAVTGQRLSQIARVVVADLQNGGAPRLLVPTSRKGKNRRAERKPLPLPHGLATALRAAAGNRPDTAPLLVNAAGQPWRQVSLVLWRQVTGALGLDRKLVPYALRHSSIVRMLLAGTPTRVVASAHDTSTAVLEAVYSRHILGDASDALIRRAQLDLEAAPTGNVVPLERSRP